MKDFLITKKFDLRNILNISRAGKSLEFLVEDSTAGKLVEAFSRIPTIEVCLHQGPIDNYKDREGTPFPNWKDFERRVAELDRGPEGCYLRRVGAGLQKLVEKDPAMVINMVSPAARRTRSG